MQIEVIRQRVQRNLYRLLGGGKSGNLPVR